MVILTRFLLLLSVVLTGFAQAAVAGTFYIDYASGNDSNTGTNKSAPWKRCPGMPGFSGAYSHTSGDRFIFKGGVTWAASAFPCNYTYSGSGESNRDYIGVDKAWFAGASWTRPLCDFQNQSLPNGWRISGSYVTIDNFEMKGLKGNGSVSNPVSVVNCSPPAGFVTVSNCVLHDCPPSSVNIDDAPIFVQAGFNAAPGITATGCEIHQANTTKSGIAIRNVTTTSFCHIHHIPNAILGFGSIHDNLIHNIGPADAKQSNGDVVHSNAIETFAGAPEIYNNVIHDLDNTCTPLSIGGGITDLQGASGTVYNNVFYNCGIQTVGNDTRGGGGANFLKFYNNTFVGVSNVVCYDGTLVCEVRNNHFISSGQVNGSRIGKLTNDHNLSQTASQAAAAGYTAANNFQPMSSNAPTVNAGAPMSGFNFDQKNAARPQGGAWDIGAFEFGGAAPTPGPSSTPQPTAAPTAGPSATPAPTATPSPSLGLSFDATDGAITAPFVSTAGGISQGLQTTDPNLGGRAVYSFTVSSAGDYGIVADVNCPGDGNNSFFINVDAEPTAPSMIWDAAPTSGVEQRIVSWRGTGSDTANQFAPKIFTLNQGTHQLILRGRESAAEIDHLTVVKVPAPPTNLILKP